jgi:hypothetical protein
MSWRLVETAPVREIAAHPETISAAGLDRFELRDELLFIRLGIAYGTPLFEDPTLPIGEIHGRPRSEAELVRRSMTIRKSA